MENINFEKTPKQILENLEKTGRYVFHGSPFKINKFEPRQAFNHIKKDNGEYEKIPDGEPAVFTSPFAKTAIFMAVMNGKNAPFESRTGFSSNNNGSFEFRATKETMDQIGDDAFGYVYVFEKENFKEINFNESVSYEEIEPVMYIQVSKKDLPEIIIKDF
ncbi:MAG: hypothetical protein QG580_81 [Patescibacteria group bacterium]|jgi:hypothetical protein|nr:hypothetical protein [Patescibacteria group bacterium]